MSLPGLSVLNCSPMSVKDFFSDAAAKTISFPLPAASDDDGEEESSDDPQPAIGKGSTAVTAGRTGYQLHDCPPEVSTITVVAFTTATATLPDSSFNSRAASALISDTTVNGPHFIST